MKLTYVLIVLATSFTCACKARDPGASASQFKTDETKVVLSDLCRQFEPDGVLPEIKEQLCTCIKRNANSLGATMYTKLCRDDGIGKHLTRLRTHLIKESSSGFQNTNNDPLQANDVSCQESLTDHYLEIYLSMIADQCDKSPEPAAALQSLLDLPGPAGNNRCWVLARMNKNACIIAKPCQGSGPSDLAALPLSAETLESLRKQGISSAQEGESVTLCNKNIQDIHFLKDPTSVNIDYNLSYANLLAFGRSSKTYTFGPANCHGTAQAVAGGLLESFPVTEITYHSPTVKEECSALASMQLDDARSKSPGQVALAGNLPVERGGYLINMNHDKSCDAKQCGTVSYAIDNCDGGKALAHIFFNGMCINCWAAQLKKAGFSELGGTASWRALRPGCILTASDHSVAFLTESSGMCYYYESTSPYGAPQLRVETCNLFFEKFPRRWCPAQDLAFDLIPQQ